MGFRFTGNNPRFLAQVALEWATTRGSHSGRTAWQFTQDLVGRLGRPLIAADDASPATTRATAKTP
jgi:predicted AAA+ superfamily ATPase